ncbi:hypothetical protein IscW_ISCW000844, partial [Ixodes scapularis]
EHTITNCIETIGPPVYFGIGRLAPNRYHVAKNQFDRMLELGLLRPSSSNWSCQYKRSQRYKWLMTRRVE